MIQGNRHKKGREGAASPEYLRTSGQGIYNVCRFGIFTCLMFTLLLAFAPSHASASIQGEAYVYNLANFNGIILSQWANIYVDKEREETYVVSSETRDIKIFDKNGMEVYVFGDEGRFGYITDLTVDKDGNIIILSRNNAGLDIIRCNYRGQPKSKIELKNLPPDFSSFMPNRIVHQKGKLYMIEERLADNLKCDKA